MIQTAGLQGISTTGAYWQMNVALESGKIDMVEKFGLFNINLGMIAKINPFTNPSVYLPLFILVMLTVFTTFYSTKIMMKLTQSNSCNNNSMANAKKDSKDKSAEDMGASMQKSMMFIAPIMTCLISFQAPAALVLYWLVNNIFQVIQQYFIHGVTLKKKED